jgi:type III secretion system FlhB-like substrate exporter
MSKQKMTQIPKNVLDRYKKGAGSASASSSSQNTVSRLRQMMQSARSSGNTSELRKVIARVDTLHDFPQETAEVMAEIAGFIAELDYKREHKE